MDIKTYRNIIEYRMDKCKELIFSKGAEYATPENVFSNFEEAAQLKDCSPAMVVWDYTMKHIISVQELLNFANGFDRAGLIEAASKRFKVPAEKAIDVLEAKLLEKTTDIINYMLILSAMFDANRTIKEPASEPSEDPNTKKDWKMPRDMDEVANLAYSIAKKRGFYGPESMLKDDLIHLYSEVTEVCKEADKNDLPALLTELADVIINASNIIKHFKGDVAEIVNKKLMQDIRRISQTNVDIAEYIKDVLRRANS